LKFTIPFPVPEPDVIVISKGALLIADQLQPPAWIYAKLERWHHLSLLRSREVMSTLHDIEVNAARGGRKDDEPRTCGGCAALDRALEFFPVGGEALEFASKKCLYRDNHSLRILLTDRDPDIHILGGPDITVVSDRMAPNQKIFNAVVVERL